MNHFSAGQTGRFNKPCISLTFCPTCTSSLTTDLVIQVGKTTSLTTAHFFSVTKGYGIHTYGDRLILKVT